MKMRKYMVYMDDGKDCFKLAVPAEDRKGAQKFVQGNGEVIAIKDVSEDFPLSSSKVFIALERAGFSEIEIDYIVRALREIDICDAD